MLATDIYGLSEIIGPGVAQECHHKDGLHVFSDVFYPGDHRPADAANRSPKARSGELVITTLTKQGIPLHPLPNAGHRQHATTTSAAAAGPAPASARSRAAPTT